MANKSIFKDDVYSHIEDDVEKIRTKPGMYIPYKGSEGAKHLAQELVDNVFDENNNPESPGDTFEMMYDENTNQIEVADNGRGIPFEHVVMISTKIQSGSKFDRNNGDNSAGENGVGLTAVNALSHLLRYTIYRQITDTVSQKGIFVFNEGKFIDKKITEVKGSKHGTRVTIIPSEEILGKCTIDPDVLINWLDKLSYVSGNTPMKLIIIRKGSDTPTVYRFKRKNGIVDYVDALSKDPIVKPIYITGESDSDNIGFIQLAFTYDPKKLDEVSDSFVNRINTIEGGQHVNAVRSAISSVLSKLANEALTEAEKKRFTVTLDDCKAGLVMVVNLSCKYPGYAGQQKEKCGNKDLFIPIRNIITRKVFNYFRDHPKELQKIVGHLKRVAKSRLEVVKIRKSDIATFDSFKSNRMASFSDVTEDTNDAELWIVEGLSAKGTLMKARDPRYQAILGLRGVGLNSMDLPVSKVLSNIEYSTFVRASGMGIGNEFNLSKSRYKRYIVATDADIDGGRITSGFCAHCLAHCTPMVEAGMLYKALIPLYMIEKSNGKYDYLVSKSALFDAKVENYIKFAQIRDRKGHIMTKQEMSDFLKANKNYGDILKELYSHEFVHPDIIEFVVSNSHSYGFEVKLRERFPEIKLVADNMLEGSHKGVYQFLLFDDLFDTKAEKLRQMIDNVNHGEVYYDFKDRDSDTWEKDCSIGVILKKLSKYDDEIKSRWKGLGSIPPKIFWDIVMNPAKRTLIQLTVTDLEKDMEMMRVLHGPDPKLRRDLLQTYKLDKDDIDN